MKIKVIIIDAISAGRVLIIFFLLFLFPQEIIGPKPMTKIAGINIGTIIEL